MAEILKTIQISKLSYRTDCLKSDDVFLKSKVNKKVPGLTEL